MKVLAVLAVAAFASGCTTSEGRGFATLTGAELEAHIDFAGREAERELLTDRDFQVRLERCSLFVEDLVLEAEGDEDVEAPDHGHGHTHAALTGEEPHYAPIVSVHVDSEYDVLSGAPLQLDHFEPSAELPRSELRALSLAMTRFVASGTVTLPGEPEPTEHPLEIDLPVSASVTAELEHTVDEHGPERLHLHAELVLPHGVFDGIDFAALASEAQGDAVRIGSTTDPQASVIRDALLASELIVTLE